LVLLSAGAVFSVFGLALEVFSLAEGGLFEVSAEVFPSALSPVPPLLESSFLPP
jgi:hypothetical protein